MSGFSMPGAAPARNRLVGLGLVLVVLGWVVLVADLVLSAMGLGAGSLVAVLSLKGDIAIIAELLVVTGLGLALLGALREGFGALNRFFEAVLQRSVAASGRPAPEPPPVDAAAVRPAPERGSPDRERGSPAAERGPPERDRGPLERPPAPAPGRNYQILPDGSVEVETLLGTRVFASMDEARDFIR